LPLQRSILTDGFMVNDLECKTKKSVE